MRSIPTQDGLFRTSDGGHLGSTRDAGLMWIVLTLPVESGSIASDVLHWSEDSQTIVAQYHNRLDATTDGGATWTAVAGGDPRDDFNSGASDVLFRDASNGINVSSAAIRRTTDGGRTWQRSPIWTQPNPSAPVELVSAGGNAVRLRRGGSLYYSSDFGATSAPTTVPAPLVGMSWIDATQGWILDSYQIHRTSDAGAHWSAVKGPWTTPLQFGAFTSMSMGAVVASPEWNEDYPHVWRMEDGGKTWIAVAHNLWGDLRASGGASGR